MKKIILKYKLQNRDDFEDKLDNQGYDFGAIYWQHDRVYLPRGYKRGMNYPRLVMRTDLKAIDEPPKYYLILRRHIEDSGVDIVETTPVADYATTASIILQLGFEQAGEVSRRRQELDMDDHTKIYLDEIDGKDETYAKIEATLKDSDSVEEIKNKLTEIFETINEKNIVEKTYFEL